jgi:hypothetical protein
MIGNVFAVALPWKCKELKQRQGRFEEILLEEEL